MKADNTTRERLLEVGLTHFLERGYAATGLGVVLKAAGVPKGSFYHFFSSKEAYAIEVVHHYASLNAKERRILLEGKAAPRQRIYDHFAQYAARFGTQIDGGESIGGCLLGNLAQEAAEHRVDLQVAINAALNAWQQDIQYALDEAVDTEAFSVPHTEHLAACLIDAWEGALLVAKGTKSRAPLDRFLQLTCKTLLALP